MGHSIKALGYIPLISRVFGLARVAQSMVSANQR